VAVAVDIVEVGETGVAVVVVVVAVAIAGVVKNRRLYSTIKEKERVT
jgi:hypothetical protein